MLRSIALCFSMMLGGVAFAASPSRDLPTFRIEARDGRFFPDTIEVPANTRWRLEVTNRNAGPEEFESRELYKEVVLAPGVTRTLVFAPMKPGTYPFFGEFHSDTAHGRIIVKQEPSQ